MKQPAPQMTKPAPQMTQPAPKTGKDDVTKAVMDDLAERQRIGIRKYGTKLQTHNGRDALMDAYEEALDLCQYLKQEIMERENGRES